MNSRIIHAAVGAALVAACAGGHASAQVTNTPIPLNYNGHIMVHSGEQVATDTNANADAIQYRSIADRGLFWGDATNQHAFGSLPLVGGTGIGYSLFNTVGYANTTAANAAASGLDGIFMGSRVWDRGLEFDPTPLTSTGSQTAWAPVYDITSLTAAGGVATATTSVAHGLTVGRRVAIVGAAPGDFDGEVTVTGVPNATTFTYATSATGAATGSIFTNSTKVPQALYITSDGGATMAVKTITAHGFAVGGNNQITITGSSIPAYNTQGLVTAINAATTLSGNGSVVTATTTVNHGFATGDSVTIAGASGGTGTWNGTFTVTVTGDKTFTYTATGNGTPTGTITSANTRVFYMANTNAGSGVAAGTRIVAATDTQTGPQTTVLSSPVALDDNAEIGVLYMISDSGGIFDVDLNVSNGSNSFTIPARLASADWFGNTAEVGTYSPFVSLHKRMTHTVGGTVYTTFQGCSNNDAGTLNAFSTSNAGPNLQVTEGVVSIPLYKAATGTSLAGYSLNSITFKNAITNQYTSVTNIVSDGTTCTVTLGGVTDYIIGQPIEITGIAQTAVSTATGISGDGANATFTTAAPHGLSTGQWITVSGATPSGFNTITPVQITVMNGTQFFYANATTGASTAAGTATVVAGAMPVNGIYKVTAINHNASQVSFPCSAIAPTSTGTALLNNNNKITTAAAASGVITFTTAIPHGLASAGGDMVTLSGFATANLNGVYRTIDAPTSTTFRVRNPNTASSTGQRTLNRFGRGRGYSIYAASVRTGAPANASCAPALPIGPSNPVGVTVSGTNSHANETTAPTHTCGTSDNTAVYYTYTATGSNPVAITTCAGFAHSVSVFTGSCGSLTQVTGACATSTTATGCGGATSPNVSATISPFTATAGTTYYIRLAGNSGAMGQFSLTVQEFTNTSCSGAVSITGGDTLGTTIANASGGTTPCGGGNDRNAVWYMYTATGAGSHTVEARTCLDGQLSSWSPSPLISGVTGVRPASCSSSTLVYPLDTTLAVYSMSQCGQASPTPIICNDDGCSVSSRVQWTAVGGTTYLIRVASKTTGYPGTGSPASGPTGNFVLHIDDPIHTDLAVPLTFNWNGICHGTKSVADANFFSEQSVTTPANHENRSDLNGYRSISDRGLLFDPNNTTQNAFNYGGTIGYQGMQYSVYGTALQNDIVHVAQQSNPYRGGGFSATSVTWATPATANPQAGYLPLWLSGNAATGTPTYDHYSNVVSNVSAMNAVFGPNTKLGLIYHMTNLGGNVGSFRVTLTFADNFQAQITCNGTDWFGGTSATPCGASLPTNLPAGIEAHRILGVYNAVQNVDRGDAAPSGQLKVAESIISTTSLTAAGLDPRGHGILTSIKFDNVTSTDTGTNVSIFAASLRDPLSYNFTNGPSAIGTVAPNLLNAGGTGTMTVNVTLGSAPSNTITSVVVDASTIGLGNPFPLTVVAGSNTTQWRRLVSFPVNTPPSAFSLPFVATDVQGRQATGSIIFSVVTPTGTFTPSTVAQGGTTNARFIFGAAGGISSISLDGSTLGLSGSIPLNDSGQPGDATANDGTWGGNLVVPAATPAGNYTIPYTITDTASNVVMGTIPLTVILPPPANDDCSGAIALSLNTTYNGDNSQATTDTSAASTCQASVSKDVWFSFTPAASGTYLVSSCGTTIDTVLSIFNAGITCTGVGNTANILACNDDGGPGCTGLAASQTATLTAGSTYLIRLQSFGAAAAGGAYSIIVTPYTTGACCNNTSGACTLVGSTACSATTSTYQGDNTTCPTTCAVTGVCCNSTSGACTSIYGGSCPSGTSSGSGTTCDANTCPPVGTCCDNATGNCTPTFGFTCAATATFNSATSCTPAPCVASGACCNNTTGVCTLIYGGVCPNTSTAGATGASCQAGSCPAEGVCCDNATSACTVIFGGPCPASGSFDPATSCVSSPCPPIAWACCLGDGSCLTRFQSDCGSINGSWQAGQACGTAVCPGSSNFVQNPGAETADMSGWTIDANGGNGWSATSDQTVHSGSHSFSTSYALARRHQVIDLLAAGYTPAQLDAAPTIAVGEWVGTRGDQGGQYYVLFQLLAADQTTVIQTFNVGTSAALTPVPAGTAFFLVANNFTGYGPGVRYIRFEDGGRDQAGWAGNYGVHFDDAFAGILAPSACCSPASGCSTISNADCITAGGFPQAPGTTCSPSPCPGVCCRGATCATGVGQPACFVASGTAGARYLAGSTGCNATAVANTPCCTADYNKTNGVTVQDIFDFLGDWFNGSPYANTGSSGSGGPLSVQNIFDFLTAWFAGGCH